MHLQSYMICWIRRQHGIDGKSTKKHIACINNFKGEKTMARKLVALFLVVSMICCMFAGCASKQEYTTTKTFEADGYDITIKETENKRETTTTVEGIPIICEHMLDSDEYWLHLSDVSYELDVQVVEDCIEVKFKDDVASDDYENVVVGQSMTLAIAVPSFIEAAKWLIATAAGYYTIQGLVISADALGTTIRGVRNNSNTYRVARSIDIDAATAIRFGRMRKYNTYYVAKLSGNTVMIGQEISEWAAVSRLERGYDVFATSAFAAGWVAMKASVGYNIGTPHSAHEEGGYPHYHALGRKWINNKLHSPHAWYPYS